jgi:hypothetical protein
MSEAEWNRSQDEHVSRALALYGPDGALAYATVLPPQAAEFYNNNLALWLHGVDWPAADIRGAKLFFWYGGLGEADAVSAAYEIEKGYVGDDVLIPDAFSFTLDGQPIELGGYMTPGTSYARLRDLALILTRVQSAKRFSINWDPDTGTTFFTTGEDYDRADEPLAPAGIGPEPLDPSDMEFLLNGVPTAFSTAYLVGGHSNYVGVRAFCMLFDIWLGWEEGTGIIMDTTRGYDYGN